VRDSITVFSGQYYWLSNFYPVVDGISVEHIFQASKTTDAGWRYTILNLPTAREAKQAGRKCPLRPDWEEIKEQVMVDALAWKFSLYLPFARDLVRTGNAHLEEGNTWGDTYWGTVNGKGQNRLGILLMERREWLQKIMLGGKI
jgi:hypothetical protein